VIVTGGAGFVGSHLVEELVHRKYSVTVLDDLSNGSRNNLCSVADRVQLRVLDISRKNWIAKAPGAEVVFHLACHPRSFSFTNPQKDVSVNLIGSVNVLEYARKNDSRVVFSSNSGIYGPCKLAKESDPVSCLTPYDVDKYSTELMIRAYNKQYGIKSTIFRFATIYGPRQRVNEKYGWRPVVATFATRLLANSPVTIFGDGLQTRDLVFVKDVPDALLRSIHYMADFDIFNLSTGHETKVIDVFRMVSRFVGVRTSPCRGPPQPGEIRRMSYSNNRIRRKLGWRPTTSVKEGIRLTVEATKEQIAER
jgi:UDP-glucose 4-epimerase